MWSLISFAVLLGISNEQTISTPSSNSIPMCPCVQTSQSACQQFDRRYQAHTIEDAIAAFNDLTLDRSTVAVTTVNEDEVCETEDCASCRLFLQGKLQQVGLMEASPLEPFVSSDLTNKTCDRYRFSTPEGLAEEMAAEENSLSSEESESNEVEEVKKKKNRHHQRHKRQATPPAGATLTATDNSIIGTRYTISCTKRGASSDASGRISLCSSCWVWRKLPANYAPQYVNELICDNTDTACLSGYATCSIGTHSIDVVRNDSGILSTVALTAGSYCECKANANSAIQTLVSGSGLNNPVPSLGNGTGKG
ncbi:hypothetical protein PMAYCL1PPCAC_12836 [Pristionchus mayeri]|uniref:C6 domain-containing protein n=1 Tax=Pristionchus mayeri TaxID=1317129 RepID=A0AAN4ZPD4_9BILA|nr:hypothetical protein PMAYCL1PPCAC_12836 [Pristionchus mayeri]